MTSTTRRGKGMLSTEAARKSFFATVVDLYRSDLAFRGMADFAVIGALTLMFISPPQKVVWPWSGGQQPGSSGAGSTVSGHSGSGVTSSAPVVQGPVSAGPVIAIPFADTLKNPRLGVGFLFDVDDKAFQSSSAADRPHLAAARAAVAFRRPDEVIEHLRSANGDDPNVALLRGAAFVMREFRGSQPHRRGAVAASGQWRQCIRESAARAPARERQARRDVQPR